MFSPPKISWVVSGMKNICLHLLPVFYLIQPSSKQIICFDFQKQNSVLWCYLYSILCTLAQTIYKINYYNQTNWIWIWSCNLPFGEKFLDRFVTLFSTYRGVIQIRIETNILQIWFFLLIKAYNWKPGTFKNL